MMDSQLVDLLVCPKDRLPLRPAEDDLLARVNREIAAGRIRGVGGRPLETPLEAALVREDGKVLYPIVNGIPLLLIEEGIWLDQGQ